MKSVGNININKSRYALEQKLSKLSYVNVWLVSFRVTCTQVTMKYERFLCKFLFFATKTAKNGRQKVLTSEILS